MSTPAVPHPPHFLKPAAPFTGRGLVCLRGGRVVFADLGFDLEPGGALVLVGANGAGKSSLLRLMAGFLEPAAGALHWAGAAIRRDREAHAARTRLLGHLDAVKAVLTVAEMVQFAVRLWRPDIADPAARVAAALERLDLTGLHDVPGRFLSAGQKRRVALARLLAAPAPLWLLDEPATALDRASLGVLEAVIADHRAAGGAVALSTHADLAVPGAETLRLDDFAVREDGS